MDKKIFIVSADDDNDDQELIEEALQSYHKPHQLNKVTDGLKLLNYLQELSLSNSKFPDLIFLDLNMPVVSGRDAVKILKAPESQFRSIPVVILTTSNSKEDMSHCLKSGADQYLVKPYSFSELKVILSQAVDRFVN